MICPNVNDPEYKALAAVVGTAKAHTIWNKNNGNPVSRNADGTPSLIYQQLQTKYGNTKAIKMISRMFSDTFISMAGEQKEFSISKDDSIELKNGLVINLASNSSMSKAQQRHLLTQDYIETGEKVDTVISVLESALPGFKINRETFSTLQNTSNKNSRAFVDKNGVHFNMQSVHYDTPIHETSHIWIHALEVADLNKYNLFMDKVKESVSDNPELINIIKSKYPTLSNDKLLYEYAATLAGFTSVDKVKLFLNRNNKYVTDNKASYIFIRIAIG